MNRISSRLWVLLYCATLAHAGIDIHLSGNAFLDDHKILESIAMDPEEYDEDGLRSWREDAEFYIADLYRGVGYFDIQVKTALQKKSPDSKNWDAEVTIVEGSRYLYDSVRVVAPPAKARPEDPDDLEAKAGKPYQGEALLKDRRFLLRLYGDAGYVRVEVDDKVAVHSATKTVSVDYLVDPSYPVVFDTLVLRTTRAPPADTAAGITREKLLRDLVPYQRGDTVRISKSDKLIEKLQYTGAFNYVRFTDSLHTDTSRGSSLYLYAEEHVPGNAHSSIFYETQYGLGISADARHSNVAGTLHEVRTGASLAQFRQNMYAGYGSPLTFGYLIRFDDDADVNWYQDKTLHDHQGMFGGDFRSANSSRLTFPLAYWIRLVANAELEAKSRMLGAGLRERDLNLNFIQSAFFTFLNQQMDPTRGVRVALTWGNGGPLVKGNTFDLTEFRHNWIEAQTAQYYYLPALRQVKLATRLDGGKFFGEGGSNSERFFLGGSRSVRSYDFQSLCLEKTPGDDGTGADGACVGQNQSLAYYLASGEVRIEPFDFGSISPKSLWHHLIPIQIVPFVDYANVWDTRGNSPLDAPGNIRTSGEGYAYGLGIRYPLLGIFNLRMDFARGSGTHIFWLDLAQAF